MDLKKWAAATLGAFVVLFATGFVIHHAWLGEFYRANAAWWRPAARWGR